MHLILALAFFCLDEPPIPATVGHDDHGNRVLCDADGFCVTVPDFGGPRVVGYWWTILPVDMEPREGAKVLFTATSVGADVIEILDNMDDEYFGVAMEDSIRLFGGDISPKNAASMKRLGSSKFRERQNETERIVKEIDMGPIVWGRFSRDPEVKNRAQETWIRMKRRIDAR